jgi:hypothetical protein
MSETEPINPMDDVVEPHKPLGDKVQTGALHAGQGTGKIDYMESRIASIEAHVDHVRDDIGDMRLDLREITKTVGSVGPEIRDLDNRISHLPGKGWIFMALLIFTAAVCATIVYLEQIRQYLGIILPTSAP